jgi:hypothetical protein
MTTAEITLLTAGLTLVGTLGGVVVTGGLNLRNDREKRASDDKRRWDEERRVFSGDLVRSSFEMQRIIRPLLYPPPPTDEAFQQFTRDAERELDNARTIVAQLSILSAGLPLAWGQLLLEQLVEARLQTNRSSAAFMRTITNITRARVNFQRSVRSELGAGDDEAVDDTVLDELRRRAGIPPSPST